ncbi:glycosyl hydrolase catalytic core-domain-containing protein [Lanmaoa asiatica]|nr:glycosyl hydrolase catalytic core-domain-containing protein [Lanmaoa asiatica]
MAALKLLNLLALASVAIVALSSVPVRVNALVADRAEVARHVRAHDAIARRKRSDTSSTSGLCIPKPSSSLPPAPTTPASITPPPAPSTTSSSSAAPTSTPISASTNTLKKMGLAWPNGDASYLSNFDLPNVGFLYTWSPYLPTSLPSGIEGIPMLWGYDQISEFQSLVVQGYAKYVLGMNEPEQPSQSNMSPQDGVNLWMQYINPLKDQGYYLISPACTNSDAGLAWYQQFFSLCQSQGCHVDAIAFHAYSVDAQSIIDFATQLHNTYNMDIYMTEFADQNFSGTGGQASMDEVWNFAGTIMNFVNATPWFVGAAPFGVMYDLQGVNPDNSLLSNGYPTSLGSFYFG